jgi:hypothetical protein
MIDPRAVSYEMKKAGDALGKMYVKENPKYKQYLSLPEVSILLNVYHYITYVMILCTVLVGKLGEERLLQSCSRQRKAKLCNKRYSSVCLRWYWIAQGKGEFIKLGYIITYNEQGNF